MNKNIIKGGETSTGRGLTKLAMFELELAGSPRGAKAS